MNHLSVGDLLNEGPGAGVWVINSTEKMGVTMGIINFTVYGASNGRPSVVQVPATAIPIDLTTQATFAALTDSPDFRRLVVQKYLCIISRTDAEKLLSTPDAQKEQARVYSTSLKDVAFSATAPAEAVAMAAEIEDGIHPTALMIANTDEREEDILRNLSMHASMLSAKDLQYIASRSTNPRIKQKAAEIITSRNV